MIENMNLHTLLSVAACALLILAAPPLQAQGLRVPGSSSFGNDWRVGSSPGPSSSYGNSDSGSGSYRSPADSNTSRQYGSGSPSYGSSSAGTLPSTSSDGAASGSGGLRPAQPLAPRTPGGGL